MRLPPSRELGSGKGLAGCDFPDERLQTMVLRPGPRDDLRDGLAIRESQAAAESVREQLLGDAARNPLGVTLEQRLELANVPERLPGRQRPGRIHGQAELVRDRPFRLLALIEDESLAGRDAIPLSPAADGVEALQRETRRIDLA